MQERHWISQEQMFWTQQEWNEAFSEAQEESTQDIANLSGIEQMQLMISYLMSHYPVSQQQLTQAKLKYGS